MTEITDLHIRAVLNGAEESRDLAAVVVEADLRLGIRTEHLAGVVFQDLQELGGHHERDGQQLHGLVGRVTVHHALVTRTALVHTKSDVRALLVHKNLNLGASIQEVVVSELVKADVLEHITHQLSIVRIVLAGQLTGNDHDPILDEDFNGDSGILVVLEYIRHDGICDLVTDFIGMTVADLLTSDNFHTDFTFLPGFPFLGFIIVLLGLVLFRIT